MRLQAEVHKDRAIERRVYALHHLIGRRVLVHSHLIERFDVENLHMSFSSTQIA